MKPRQKAFLFFRLDATTLIRSPWYLLVFTLLMASSSFGVLFLLGRGPIISLIGAVLATFATLLLLMGSKVHQTEAIDYDYLFQPSSRENADERLDKAKARTLKMRDNQLYNLAWRNRKAIIIKTITVFVYLLSYALFSSALLGKTFADSMMLPLGIVVAFWAIGIIVFSQGIILGLLVFLTIISVVIQTAGPQLIFQLLPLLFTMPFLFATNFLVLIGPTILAPITQMKVLVPGDSDLETTWDHIRGQEEAKKEIMLGNKSFISGEEHDQLFRPRGILMIGAPGIGKSLSARANANENEGALILTNGSAFTSSFIAGGFLIVLYLKWLANRLAGIYKYVTIFIDEGEQLFKRRDGMGAGTAGASNDYLSLFDFDEFCSIGDLAFDTAGARKIAWQKKYPVPDHQKMMMGMGMGGGSNIALPVYLDWMDGVPSPPMWKRFVVSRTNLLLDLFIPWVIPPVVRIGKRRLVLRLPPPKPDKPRILHTTATNMPEILDPAILRRFTIHVHFVLPGEDERADVAELFARQVMDTGFLNPQLKQEQSLRDFAQATIGFSHDQIRQAYYRAPSVRQNHIDRLKHLSLQQESGIPLGDHDERYLKRYQDRMQLEGWDDPRADWESLMEAVRSIKYGLSKPTRTSKRHRRTTAYHEMAGHLFPTIYFGSDFQQPTYISVLPRGDAAGMVAHALNDEHDPRPQSYFEGLLRVLLGSVVAERLLTEYKENQQGVISDLEHATKLAAFMTGSISMSPRACSEEDAERYYRYGSKVLSQAGVTTAPDRVSATVSDPEKRRDTCILLGQAFVDVYRLILKNQDLTHAPVQRLLDEDEIMGQELRDLVADLKSKIRPITSEDQDWPDAIVDLINPFYQEVQ